MRKVIEWSSDECFDVRAARWMTRHPTSRSTRIPGLIWDLGSDPKFGSLGLAHTSVQTFTDIPRCPGFRFTRPRLVG